MNDAEFRKLVESISSELERASQHLAFILARSSSEYLFRDHVAFAAQRHLKDDLIVMMEQKENGKRVDIVFVEPGEKALNRTFEDSVAIELKPSWPGQTPSNIEGIRADFDAHRGRDNSFVMVLAYFFEQSQDRFFSHYKKERQKKFKDKDLDRWLEHLEEMLGQGPPDFVGREFQLNDVAGDTRMKARLVAWRIKPDEI